MWKGEEGRLETPGAGHEGVLGGAVGVWGPVE